MRVLVSGASGFIGRPLVSFLEKSHKIETLGTHNSSILWDPKAQKADLADFENFDAVIHLAGEPLTLSRWSAKKRQEILSSRFDNTAFLSHLLSSCRHPPKVFISASAIGFYGDRKEELLTEESGPGHTFLSRVCIAWEKATLPLKIQGVRTVQTRFGVVLGPKGGILQKLLPIYKLGLGATLSSGKQWISWVELSDLIRAMAFVLDHDTIEGPVNVTSPNPIRQRDFSHLLAKILHRPSFFHLPAWLLHLLFSDTADELLLASQKATPSKILAAKFSFKYSDLRSALVRAFQG